MKIHHAAVLGLCMIASVTAARAQDFEQPTNAQFVPIKAEMQEKLTAAKKDLRLCGLDVGDDERQAREKNACMQDFEKFCMTEYVARGICAAVVCMKAHRSHLSKECLSFF